MAEQVLEGTWEEVQRKLSTLRLTGRRVRVTVRDMNGSEVQNDISIHHKPVTYGMFPELLSLTDEDFASAEYHGDSDEL